MFSQGDFRESLKKIMWVDEHPFPWVYITGTMPPATCSHFLKGVGALLTINEIREPTNRFEHKYIAHLVPIKQQMAVAQSIITYITSTFTESSQGIVFVNSIDSGKLWEPNYPFYHAKLDVQLQENTINLWDGTESKWIIATTALLHGVDIPCVDCIIFVDDQWGMVDFIQGAGHAGRGGQQSVIYLLHGGGY